MPIKATFKLLPEALYNFHLTGWAFKYSKPASVSVTCHPTNPPPGHLPLKWLWPTQNCQY